jgi:hypothetical protein
LHFAVAPVASVLPAILPGAAVVVAAVFGAAAAGAAVVEAAAGFCDDFETPPWPLQAPFPVAVVVVPSVQVRVAPVAGVAGAGVADGAGAAAGAGAAVGAGAAAEAGAAAGAAVVFGVFLTPPWLLHAPFPVAVDVVPSAHVVGAAESAARLGGTHAKAAMDSAMSPIRFIFFMNSLPALIQSREL